MKKNSLFKTILFLTFSGLLSFTAAQSEDDFEKAGRKHFGNAFFKAMPQKNKVMADEEFALAEKAFRNAIGKKPLQIDAYLHLGRTYYVQKKYAAAVKTYRSALAIAPKQKKIYLRLASALEKAGDYQGAVNALETLRSKVTDERATMILDGFITKIEARAAQDKPNSN
jgi:cytochrome c-type biogenesis protein CcmH/NrfG